VPVRDLPPDDRPEMFKQSLLVERKHAGKKLTIECHKSGDDVSLLELLDGLKLEHLPTGPPSRTSRTACERSRFSWPRRRNCGKTATHSTNMFGSKTTTSKNTAFMWSRAMGIFRGFDVENSLAR